MTSFSVPPHQTKISSRTLSTPDPFKHSYYQHILYPVPGKETHREVKHGPTSPALSPRSATAAWSFNVTEARKLTRHSLCFSGVTPPIPPPPRVLPLLDIGRRRRRNSGDGRAGDTGYGVTTPPPSLTLAEAMSRTAVTLGPARRKIRRPPHLPCCCRHSKLPWSGLADMLNLNWAPLSKAIFCNRKNKIVNDSGTC